MPEKRIEGNSLGKHHQVPLIQHRQAPLKWIETTVLVTTAMGPDLARLTVSTKNSKLPWPAVTSLAVPSKHRFCQPQRDPVTSTFRLSVTPKPLILIGLPPFLRGGFGVPGRPLRIDRYFHLLCVEYWGSFPSHVPTLMGTWGWGY